MRDIIKLTCSNCSRANYHTTKNKRTMTEKFTVKKFCPFCRKHFEHKEGKISRAVERLRRAQPPIRQRAFAP